MAGEFCRKIDDVGRRCVMADGHYGSCAPPLWPPGPLTLAQVATEAPPGESTRNVTPEEWSLLLSDLCPNQALHAPADAAWEMTEAALTGRARIAFPVARKVVTLVCGGTAQTATQTPLVHLASIGGGGARCGPVRVEDRLVSTIGPDVTCPTCRVVPTECEFNDGAYLCRWSGLHGCMARLPLAEVRARALEEAADAYNSEHGLPKSLPAHWLRTRAARIRRDGVVGWRAVTPPECTGCGEAVPDDHRAKGWADRWRDGERRRSWIAVYLCPECIEVMQLRRVGPTP